MGFSKLCLIISGLFLALIVNHSTAQNFRCNSPSSCRALVGYITVNNTNMNAIRSLFNVSSLQSLLGANGLPPTTPGNRAIPARQLVRVPIDCVCYNGTGTSAVSPSYTIQPGDGLFHIAAEIFSRLVLFEQIAAVNNISDPDLINVGDTLKIPLPCSCDDVDGEKVVHYAHVVRPNSTLPEIAQEFGTDEVTLGRINGISAQNVLQAETPIDVPLRACNSSIRSDSLDSTLVAANGTYVLTANDCVRCTCDAANNWTLNCEPSQNRPSRWERCPSMQCEGPQGEGLSLGNVTGSGCNRSTCSYAGYNNSTIFTTLTLVQDSSCSTPTPSNDASSMSLNWEFLFILVLFCFHVIV